MRSGSIDFMEFPQSAGQLSWQDETESERIARALMILERQRRISDRLAEFERQAQARLNAAFTEKTE
ncbi:MAG: hypothetical protein H6876_01695 [Hyphomicrobiaceae bacterium]|nr:hypothetical protein [Hyphomicrobiaceae bacterium]